MVGRLFEGGRLLFSQHFHQARTLLENNITRDNKFNWLQKYKSSVSKTNVGTQLMLFLLHIGLVKKDFFVARVGAK